MLFQVITSGLLIMRVWDRTRDSVLALADRTRTAVAARRFPTAAAGPTRDWACKGRPAAQVWSLSLSLSLSLSVRVSPFPSGESQSSTSTQVPNLPTVTRRHGAVAHQTRAVTVTAQ